jgi:hypothetical protein
MSYLQRVLLGNEQLHFERSGNKDEDSWIGGSTTYSSYLSRQRPLLPYSKPATIYRDDVLTGLSIDPSQYPASPVTGRNAATNRAAYDSPRTPHSPMAVRQKSSCCKVTPSQFSPAPHSQPPQLESALSRDTASSPRAANSPLMRCSRSMRTGGGGARRLSMPLRPAPAPACLTPTAARAFHADNSDADADAAV